MFWGIELIILSIIAVPSLLLAKKPEAKEILAKVEPYQGWIGFVFCLWGIWGVISAIININVLSVYPIWWVTWLAGNFVMATLGFMLGFGLLNKFLLSNNPAATAKAVALREKMAPKLGKLGLFGIGVGVWMIVASFMFNV